MEEISVYRVDVAHVLVVLLASMWIPVIKVYHKSTYFDNVMIDGGSRLNIITL